MSLGKEIEVRKHVDLMLQNGIINESNSPWSAPVVMAWKKDGSWRFCIDYQRLNSVTKKDAYLLHRIDNTLNALGFGKGRVFSTMDFASGYWHIPIKDRNMFVVSGHLYRPLPLSQPSGLKVKIKDGFGTRPRRF